MDFVAAFVVYLASMHPVSLSGRHSIIFSCLGVFEHKILSIRVAKNTIEWNPRTDSGTVVYFFVSVFFFGVISAKWLISGEWWDESNARLTHCFTFIGFIVEETLNPAHLLVFGLSLSSTHSLDFVQILLKLWFYDVRVVGHIPHLNNSSFLDSTKAIELFSKRTDNLSFHV